MREYLKEPNDYSSQYGKWGILNIEQRQLITRLLDEMDRADVVIKKQYEEKQHLIKYLEHRINLCNRDIEEFNKNSAYWQLIEYTEAMKIAFQEVLDFIGDEKR